MNQWTDKEINEVKYLASRGWHEPEICKLFKISWREWEKSKAKSAKLCKALNEGKAAAKSYCKFMKKSCKHSKDFKQGMR